MKKNPTKQLPRFRKKTLSDVSIEMIERLKQARLAAKISLQQAGSKLGISMSTVWWMECGVCPMSQQQAEALARFYGERTCAIAANVAAVLGT